MRIRLRFLLAAGFLAALFGMLGPVSAHASQALGAPVPAVSHSSGIVNRTVQPNYRCGYGGGYNYYRYCCGRYGYGGGYNRYCYGHYDHYNHYYNHYYNHDHYYNHYSHYSHYGRR